MQLASQHNTTEKIKCSWQRNTTEHNTTQHNRREKLKCCFRTSAYSPSSFGLRFTLMAAFSLTNLHNTDYQHFRNNHQVLVSYKYLNILKHGFQTGLNLIGKIIFFKYFEAWIDEKNLTLQDSSFEDTQGDLQKCNPSPQPPPLRILKLCPYIKPTSSIIYNMFTECQKYTFGKVVKLCTKLRCHW